MYKKPEIGIVPERIWKAKRAEDLKATIIRYVSNNMITPAEWITEYNKLITDLK